MEEAEEPGNEGGNWSRIYAVVIAFLVLEIVAFLFISNHFQ